MPESKNKKRPNILFIFSDEHNARCMGCAGHPDVKTPNMDRLAAAGTRFDNAYTVNPICTPSRVSVLTALYPSTHGYYGLYGRESTEPMTSMFSYFREIGYRTGALRKLHTPRYWVERDSQFVYDEFIEHPKYLEGAGLYEYNDNRGFVKNYRGGVCSGLPLEHSCETVLAKQTNRFIHNEGEPSDRGDPDAPWFAWVCFSRPHHPFTPSEPFFSMYDPADITLPPNDEREKWRADKEKKQLNEEKLRLMVSAYYGVVSQVDYGIGLILEELERRGELDNTLIIYSSDHGDYAGEHGLHEKCAGISSRAITRIPLILCEPGACGAPNGRDSGRTVLNLVESVDLFPTICELIDVPIPNTVQGRSYAGIIRGSDRDIRETTLTENSYRKALATGGYRYVANQYGREEDELYDLQEDPWELVNRIDDPEYSEVKKDLQRRLLDRVSRARKPITSINGGWHRHKYDLDGRINLTVNETENPYW